MIAEEVDLDTSRYHLLSPGCLLVCAAFVGACSREKAPVVDTSSSARASASSAVVEAGQASLPDGIFLVETEIERRDSLGEPPKDRAILRFTVDDDEPPRFLLLREAPFVPLGLAAPPDVITKSDGDFLLHLRFDPDAADQLERFTREHAGGRIAVVIAGEVASSHKIREAIGGGELQISCCSKANCESLRAHLSERR